MLYLILSLLGLTSVVFDKPYFVHDDPRLSQVIRKYRSNLLALKANRQKMVEEPDDETILIEDIS